MWARLPFYVDVYIKAVYYNDSGQEISEWIRERTIKCDFMPARAEERLVGRVQNPTSFILYVTDTSLKNENQLRNIVDRYGEVVDSGPFNVTGIRKHHGWSKVSHLTVMCQKVLD